MSEVQIYYKNLKTIDMQNDYLMDHIEIVSHLDNDTNFRATFQYFITIGDQRRDLCRDAFLELHGISLKRMARIRIKYLDSYNVSCIHVILNKFTITLKTVGLGQNFKLFNEAIQHKCKMYYCLMSMYEYECPVYKFYKTIHI